MKDVIIAALIFIAGVVNFIPVIGVTSRARLERLYGTVISDANTEILMRHRAVMFGMLGGFMIYAAVMDDLHYLAIGGGLISMSAFIVIAYAVGGFTAQITRINKADMLAIIALLGALALKVLG